MNGCSERNVRLKLESLVQCLQRPRRLKTCSVNSVFSVAKKLLVSFVFFVVKISVLIRGIVGLDAVLPNEPIW